MFMNRAPPPSSSMRIPTSPRGRPDSASTTVPASFAGGASRSTVVSPVTSTVRLMGAPPVSALAVMLYLLSSRPSRTYPPPSSVRAFELRRPPLRVGRDHRVRDRRPPARVTSVDPVALLEGDLGRRLGLAGADRHVVEADREPARKSPSGR
jgi:hypothetical protein